MKKKMFAMYWSFGRKSLIHFGKPQKNSYTKSRKTKIHSRGFFPNCSSFLLLDINLFLQSSTSMLLTSCASYLNLLHHLIPKPKKMC